MALLPAAAEALDRPPLRMALSQLPLTLNPRAALDASGQRIGALLFRALTRIDADLEPRPDLAESWSHSKGGRLWAFRIREGLKDHGGEAIDAAKVARCLEEYRVGKPTSALAAAFPAWKATRWDPKRAEVRIELDQPDPYLPRNLSLFRYFRTDQGTPCRESPNTASWVGSGDFRPDKWNLVPEQGLLLQPMRAGWLPVRLVFARDENTLALMLLRGEIDVIQNALTLAKTRWIQTEHLDRFSVLERPGVNPAYLAFNTEDPILGNRLVRRAIAHAIPRQEVVNHKMFGFGTIAGSLLSPMLPESHQIPIRHDPEASKKLLDLAGYAPDPRGRRFGLQYRTTTVREGQEQALIIQRALKNIGIDVTLEVVEPAVFLASIRKGKFQLFASRWIGVSDGSILYRTLYSSQANNRSRYRDPAMDRLLDRAIAELDPGRRKAILKEVQIKAVEDLPFVPLWYWSNAVVIRKELAPRVDARKISLSGALEPLIYQLATP